MTWHPHIMALNAEERSKEMIAQAETDRLARAARPRRPARHRRPARAWLRRGWRLVARLRPAGMSPHPVFPDAVVDQDHEALTPEPLASSGGVRSAP
jgi:hypothetical protein